MSIAFAFSPDGRSLAVQVVTKDEVNTFTFRDLTAMRQIRKVSAALGYPANGGPVTFQPDGASVIAAPMFGRVAFPSGEVITKGGPSLEVDPVSDDGTTPYTHPRGFRPYIRLWDARTLRPMGQDLSTGPVRTSLSAPETATAVSPDGRLFATVHASRPGHQIKVWDSRTRTQLGVPLTGPARRPWPGGSPVATGVRPPHWWPRGAAPRHEEVVGCRRRTLQSSPLRPYGPRCGRRTGRPISVPCRCSPEGSSTSATGAP
ncbi:hypothetical protein [Streptomyces sp. NPDC086989]|uniref:hypothetical protein n=1 Tax=Streptomyces sp. NPDC086989 TaxID=3365764 RepID=UPI0038126099